MNISNLDLVLVFHKIMYVVRSSVKSTVFPFIPVPSMAEQEKKLPSKLSCVMSMPLLNVYYFLRLGLWLLLLLSSSFSQLLFLGCQPGCYRLLNLFTLEITNLKCGRDKVVNTKYTIHIPYELGVTRHTCPTYKHLFPRLIRMLFS